MRERTRKKFADRYEALFGCAWPETPWGAQWTEVVATAREAEREYLIGERLLRDILEAIGHAFDHVLARGMDLFQEYDEARTIGRTEPEVALYIELANLDSPMARVLGQLYRHVQELHLPAGAKGAKDQALVDFIARYDGVPISTHFLEHQKQNYRTSFTRRYARVNFYDPKTFELVRTVVGPAITGPPSRSPDGDEWRRAYLVELLDSYWAEDRQQPGTYLRLSNGVIAIISLLGGGLDALTARELRRGAPAVLNAERKAIGLAMKRRAFTGNFSAALEEKKKGLESKPAKE